MIQIQDSMWGIKIIRMMMWRKLCSVMKSNKDKLLENIDEELCCLLYSSLFSLTFFTNNKSIY